MKNRILIVFLLFVSATATAQVGIGTDTPKATLHISEDLTANNTIGIIPPRVPSSKLNQLKGLYTNEHHGTIVFVTGVDEIASEKTQKVTGLGYYYYHHPQGDNVSGEWRELGLQSNDARFFYMPSVSLPTVLSDTRITDVNNTDFNYDTDSQLFSVDLYNIFKKQFNNPLAKSSNGGETAIAYSGTLPNNTNSGLTGFTLTSADLQYFVTYADLNLFKEIAVNDLGVLTYKVDPSVIIRNGSFMNIVLKVK